MIADAVGLSSVHVNRALQHLREEGLITLRGGMLSLVDLEKFRKVAGFDPKYLHRGDVAKQ